MRRVPPLKGLQAGVGVTGVLLVALGVFGPWWTVSAYAQPCAPACVPPSSHQDLGLLGWLQVQQGSGGSSYTTTGPYMRPETDTVGISLVLAGSATALSAVAVTWMVAAPLRVRKFGILLGVLAFSVSLASLVVFAIGFPDAHCRAQQCSQSPGFWDAIISRFGAVYYGAGWGWYVSLAGAACVFASALLLLGMYLRESRMRSHREDGQTS